MSHKYSGGCAHIQTHADHEPIDNHTCHCSVCKGVTGQDTTHVVFFRHGDVAVDNEAGLNRQPFNANNPDGPLELCTCADCGAPIMLDDKQSRIRVIVPNLMGYDDQIGKRGAVRRGASPTTRHPSVTRSASASSSTVSVETNSPPVASARHLATVWPS